ncbi:murein biosynthesis integral membrane protein MurJ [Micromonospora sp. HM5-17]|jgi:putative peptidoglycan lipid II flippase|uniref:murein biosynthesis integral membrane protein MurJ n=1 Tax=Micromonospora sp. HM5-17 TaxID=2487710 RepID=UPI000F47E993|nr:murein biosynthesis integral membrane protein MurJ [Micromonospora sp. HM5-17]ROT33633.1 murein biosynthesis integral membrane protein MurJ [Micromonospora sp. HM5-17]
MAGGLYRSANAMPDGVPPPRDGATLISTSPIIESTNPPPETAEGSAASNSAIMAIGSLVSRGTGFLRTLMVVAALGNFAVNDAYATALIIPQMVYEFLLGGVLTSVVVPVLVRRRKLDPDGGQAYAQRLLTLAGLALGIASVLAILLAGVLSEIYAGGRGEDYQELVTDLSRLLLPIIFFSGLSALIAAVLNTRGHFAAPMWAPILNNLVIIAACALYIAIYGAKVIEPGEMSRGQILLLGGGTLLGIVVQVAGLLPALRRVGFRWRPRFDFRELGLRELGRLGAWMFCYVAVNSLGLIVLFNLLNQVGHDSAGPAIYNNVFLLLMMAHGIIAVSIITALMPRMSAAAADGRFADMAADLSRTVRTVAAVLAPIAVCYAVLAEPIAVVLFNYGAGAGDAGAISPVLLVAALALVPFAISQVFTFAFWALPDTRTPALINIPVVVLRIVVQVLVFAVLPLSFLASGMMIGNGVSYVAAAVISASLLRSRIGRLGFGTIASTLGRVLVAALGATLVGLLVVVLLPGEALSSRWLGFVEVALGGAAIGGTYLGLALVLGIREITDVVDMVRRRLGR